jgi:hypothetical protein
MHQEVRRYKKHMHATATTHFFPQYTSNWYGRELCRDAGYGPDNLNWPASSLARAPDS